MKGDVSFSIGYSKKTYSKKMKIKKKLLTLLFSTIFFTYPIFADSIQLSYDGNIHSYTLDSIELIVDNQIIDNISMPPIQLNGRVLVPAREVFEPLGAQVEWKPSEKKVYIDYNGSLIVLEIDNTVVWKDGNLIDLDAPAKIINEKIMIPARFVAENLGLNVLWDNNARIISIDNKKTESGGSDEKYEDSNNIEEPIIKENSSLIKPSNSSKPIIQGNNLTKDKLVYEHNVSYESAYSLMNSNKALKSAAIDIEDTKSSITIYFDNPITSIDAFKNQNKIVVDIKNCNNLLSNTINLSNPYVEKIRTSQFNESDTRVVLDLKTSVEFKAILSTDKKSLTIDMQNSPLTYFQVEEIGNSNRLYLENIFSNQIQVLPNSSGSIIEITVPNTYIENSILWNDVKGLYIKNVSMKNTNNSVVIQIDTLNNPKLSINQHTNTDGEYYGTTIDLNSQKNKNITYTTGTHPKITIPKIDGLKIAESSILDDYRNRKIIVDLGKNFGDTIENKVLNTSDLWMGKVEIKTDTTTKIIFNEKSILAYNIIENQDSYEIQFLLPKEKYSKILVLDPGHGGTDSGSSSGNYIEKNMINQQIKEITRLLEKNASIKTYITREESLYRPLDFRTNLANEVHADFYLSLHYNCFTNSSVNGTEMLYHPTKNALDQKIAQYLQNEFVNKLNLTDRKVKSRPDLYVLRNSNMSAVLIEVGFLSNPQEAAKLTNPEFISKTAKTIYDSILYIFNNYVKSGTKTYKELSLITTPNEVSQSNTTSNYEEEAFDLNEFETNQSHDIEESFVVVQS